jgi:hypothetical protein
VLIIPSSWGSQLGAYHAPSSIFLAPLPGRKRISVRGVSRFHSFLLCYYIAYFLYFIFSCIFLSKIQKNSSFIVVIFACLLFSLARMSNPEVEVRTFKQQGGESLKDAWY